MNPAPRGRFVLEVPGRAPAHGYEYAERARLVQGGREPVSPLMLIQEVAPSRFWALVGAVLCCRTRRKQSHTAALGMMALWDGPEELADADGVALAWHLKPTGFHERRSDQLRRLAAGWVAGVPVPDLPGVGEYVNDSDRIFGLGVLTHTPVDSELHSLVRWARARSRDGLPWRAPWTLNHGRQ